MGFGSQELLIILAIVIILFGAKKIPDLAKGLGKGIKDFKKAVREDEEEEAKNVSTSNEKIEADTKDTQSSKSEETTKA
jgi:sec-independent protein translocase protein TatA